MKRPIIYLAVLLLGIACGRKQQNFTPAESALDAGREFIDACLKGDFTKAAFYMAPDSTNERYLKQVEGIYRNADRTGRQELRTASININQVEELNDSTTIIHYSNSLDKTPYKLKVRSNKGSWLVDLKFTYNPNL